MSLEVNNLLNVSQEQESEIVDKQNAIGDDDGKAELDIVINNVVCSFSVKCHLNLHDIALNGVNVEYRRENSMLTMRLRRPYTTASIWSSGRITCTGATSEEDARTAARRYARCLQKLGFPVGFHNFRIYNVLGTCTMPWAIRIVQFSEHHRNQASYEPELHPGVTYRMTDPIATLKIFATGSITVTAQNVATVDLAIQRIYDLVYEFRNESSRRDLGESQLKDCLSKTPRHPAFGAPRAASTTWRPKPQVHSYMKFLDSIPNTMPPQMNKKASINNTLTNTALINTTLIKNISNNNTSIKNSLNNTVLTNTSINNLTNCALTNTTLTNTALTNTSLTKTSLTNTTSINATSINDAEMSSSSGSDNIFSNARRRASERWVTKLQEKQSRLTDPSSFVNTTVLPAPRSVSQTIKKPLLPHNKQLNTNNLRRPKALPRSASILPPIPTRRTTIAAPIATRKKPAAVNVNVPSNMQLVETADSEEVAEDEMNWQM
ncbi:putative uncharacterized protein DDB_G0291812 [Drosophila sulfurigaster albostrigata]|uniref:putative uncharacterized protein DDB_G0291812 n=1 Tax=Drosophila sulfurigaster albostrigata TaxID=89887 RepID=UPI002D21E2B4|nr:putative uncharacterized protein DDB_G0291812 [Drosophila sulfurigaster albostrigata]